MAFTMFSRRTLFPAALAASVLFAQLPLLLSSCNSQEGKTDAPAAKAAAAPAAVAKAEPKAPAPVVALETASAKAPKAPAPVVAALKLPTVFSSNMVLQQGMPVKIWGWAAPGETVSASFGSAKASAKADAKGEWKLELPAQKASDMPAKLTVKDSKKEIVLDNVLVGEVWLCSGQSNMQMGIGVSDNGAEAIKNCANKNIRLFTVKNKFSPVALDDVGSNGWQVCNPEALGGAKGWGGFSAAGYYFGKELNKSLNVPVGLIESSWGGTRIEPWIPPVGFAAVPALKDLYKSVLLRDFTTSEHKAAVDELVKSVGKWRESALQARDAEIAVPAYPAMPSEFVLPTQGQQQTPCWLYNAMINGIVPFQFKGAIWYQGESNHGEGMLYVEKTKAQVLGWRKVFENPDMPYYLVQIAPYQYGSESIFREPEFWEAQFAILKAVPNTGIVCTMDIADLKDIHPKNKLEVGRRLALQALAKTYGKKDIAADSPSFKSFAVEGSKMRVSFDNVPTGLKTRDGKPVDWFEIIDADNGGFVNAKAEIDGKTVVLSADGVSKPVAVRFGWSKLAEPNLVSSEGLPVYPFRAGEVPTRNPLTNIPGASGYELVYDLDLAKIGGRDIKYSVDNSASFKGEFDRVAYFLEIGKKDAPEYVFVSIPAFTNDIKKIGVPSLASKASFQKSFDRMDVYSSVAGIVSGTGLKGNMEFWPNNYGPANAAKVPDASDSTYDFGDQMSAPEDGYGCMQIHNYVAKQTVFAINNWKAGAGANIGIGNSKGNTADWTFVSNANSYEFKRLRVFVHPK